MKKLRQILGSDPVTLIMRLRHGPKILAAGWLALHVLFVYEIVVGKMKLPWRFEWIEGRASSPIMFWLYIGGSGGVLLLCDIFWLRSVFNDRRRKDSN